MNAYIIVKAPIVTTGIFITLPKTNANIIEIKTFLILILSNKILQIIPNVNNSKKLFILIFIP